MAVFVDDVRHVFGRMIMCHMWADTMDELLAMATKIGVAHHWLQKPPKASWIHFDISLTKKAAAIQHGAILTDRYGPVIFENTQRIIAIEAKVSQIRAEIANGVDPDSLSEDHSGISLKDKIEYLLARRAKCQGMVDTVNKLRAERAIENRAESGAKAQAEPAAQESFGF